jgi:hypothetical protein
MNCEERTEFRRSVEAGQEPVDILYHGWHVHVDAGRVWYPEEMAGGGALRTEAEIDSWMSIWMPRYMTDEPEMSVEAVDYQTPVQFEASFKQKPTTSNSLRIAA